MALPRYLYRFICFGWNIDDDAFSGNPFYIYPCKIMSENPMH